MFGYINLETGMDVQKQEKHISSERARKFGNCSTLDSAHEISTY